MVCHSIKTPWSDRNVHLVDPPQVMEDVDVDCALPGAAGHPVPAPDAVGHQSHQIMSPAEPIPEIKDQFGGRTITALTLGFGELLILTFQGRVRWLRVFQAV